jgi:hypothetical protein
MLSLPPMLLAVAIGGLAAAWLQERADTRRSRRRRMRALQVDAAVWETDADAPPPTAPRRSADGDDRIAKATADARVDAAVRRAAAAEAAAADAEEAAASYRAAYLAACEPDRDAADAVAPPPPATLEMASPRNEDGNDAYSGGAATHEDAAAAAAGDSASESDAEWDRVSLAAPRCCRCNGVARERAAFVPCGHTACAACALPATACFACGELVTYALRLQE